MNPQKRLQTLAERAEARKTQALKIGDWTVYRFDQLNWVVKHKGKLRGYYGTISQALLALPHKMLDETSFNSLSDIQENLQGIRDLIKESLTPDESPKLP